jgi:hypothetical protein
LNLLAILRFRLSEIYLAHPIRREGSGAVLQNSWGKEVIRERFTFQIARYHDLVKGGRATVDETTWQDLGMDEVFAKIDRTSSFPGRQVLFHQTRTYEADESVLAERTRQHSVFRSDPGLREAAQRHLVGLDDPDAAWLAPLLLSEFPKKPGWAWLMHVCGLTPLACFIGMVWWPVLLIPGVIIGLMNLVINETYGRKITPYFGGLSQIHRLLRVAEGLSTLSNAARLPQLVDLQETAPARPLLKKRLGWLAMDREKLGDLIMSLITYANLFFLVDIQIYLGSLTTLRRHQAALVKMMEAVGSMDAAISVASFMDGVPVVVTPTLIGERRIEAEGLYHPLLANPVGNPILCNGRSILITGSNMAGKTTFLRTVGINVILAQTLNLCLADKAVMPQAIVSSSIRREDRLAQGDSFYAVELARIQEMLQDAQEDHLHLFLLDEIFRGTNTLERISAATAVLHHLGQAHLALVTTHDLELQDLLADGFDMFHFSEQIVDGKYGFNYCIQPGPTKGRNAIRLLELHGYPESITSEARLLADRLAPLLGT